MEIRTCPFFDDLLNRTMIPRPRHVIKLIRDNQCGFYGNIPYVCCQKSMPETTTITTEAQTTPPSTTQLPFIPASVTERYEQEEEIASHDNLENIITSHPNYRLLANDICGPIATDGRITSGSKATLNEYPWMALIAYDVGELIALINKIDSFFCFTRFFNCFLLI